MIGRKCRVTEPDTSLVWVGRVVACQLSPRVVTPDTDSSYPEVVRDEWRLLVEDEGGVLFSPPVSQVALLPVDSPAPLGIVEGAE
jgi:hypothetical protein